MKFYDTNAILDCSEDIFKEKFYISSETLRELENIKNSSRKDEQVKYRARRITRLLSKHSSSYQVVLFDKDIRNIMIQFGLEDIPDNRICASAYRCAQGEPIVFVTNDLCCKVTAQGVLGLTVEWLEDERQEIYKGYQKIVGDTEYINEIMANMDYSKWYTNEYCIIQNIDDDSIKEMRFDGQGFVPLKLPPSKIIKGKNALQRCALDMLFNPNITICSLLGGYGSGKTMLSTKCALTSVLDKGWQSKIITLREVVSEGKEIGYLPGEKDSKILDFMLPFADQLDGGEFELESLKQRGVIEANTPYFIKGRTFNSSILLVDEAEDLTEKQIRLIGTRVGLGSRVFYTGDYSQSVINPSKDNALVKMCKALRGDEKFACIFLEEDVRSETSRLFANLFKE